MTTTSVPTRSPAPEGFAPLSAGVLDLIERTPTPAYVFSDQGRPTLLCKSGESCEQVRVSAPPCLLLKQGDFIALSRSITKQLPGVYEDARLPQADRLAILVASMASEVEAACSLIKPQRLIELCKSASDCVFELLHVGQVKPIELYNTPRVGSAWLNHATSVACYSVLLAITVGIRAEEDLRRISLGAMLHDLGLRQPPDRSLSSEETRHRYTGHPQAAYEQLQGDPQLDDAQRKMIYQHHESLDGNGFPVGVLEDEIHPWAQLLRVTDTFDELTHAAAARQKLTTAEALKRLNREAGAALNKEMVQCWTQVMS